MYDIDIFIFRYIHGKSGQSSVHFIHHLSISIVLKDDVKKNLVGVKRKMSLMSRRNLKNISSTRNVFFIFHGCFTSFREATNIERRKISSHRIFSSFFADILLLLVKQQIMKNISSTSNIFFFANVFLERQISF